MIVPSSLALKPEGSVATSQLMMTTTASHSHTTMLPNSVDFIHKKYVFGEMKSVCGSVEFSGKLDRLLIFTSFGQNSPYVRKNFVRNIRVEKRCSLSKIF